MEISVRSLAASDKSSWIALWNSYQQFYGVALPETTTEATWRRLKETTEPIGAFAADDGKSIVGFVHYIFHRSTWMVADTCYLQDLFVQATSRRRGAARKLIDAVYAEADRKGAGQVYWLTHQSNDNGRRLYDKVAVNSGFVLYERFAETNR